MYIDTYTYTFCSFARPKLDSRLTAAFALLFQLKEIRSFGT